MEILPAGQQIASAATEEFASTLVFRLVKDL